MPRTHRERLVRAALRFLSQGLMPLRRHVMSAAALFLVASAVLLVLDARLPFPSPGERILFDPSDLSMLLRSSVVSAPRKGLEKTTVPALSMGGYTPLQPPLTVMLYRAKPGDTFSGIAGRLASISIPSPR